MDGIITSVISNLDINSILKNPTTRIDVTDLFNINKTIDSTELFIECEIIKENIKENIKDEIQKHKDIEEISSKIIELNNTIKIHKGGCVYAEDHEVKKLTKKLNQILGIDTNILNDTYCTAHPDDIDDTDDTCSNGSSVSFGSRCSDEETDSDYCPSYDNAKNN